jgi:hypothetical protein
MNLRWNGFQAFDGSGICRASCGLQKGIEWFSRLVISRGWWGTLARTIFFRITLKGQLCFRTHNGPVGESMIAARNSDRGAGNRTWASTLPAPAD